MQKDSSLKVLLFHGISPTPAMEEAWGTFVNENKDGNVFQTPAFFKSYLNDKKNNPFAFLLIEEAKGVVGCMVGVILKQYKSPLGFISARAIITGGPLLEQYSAQYIKALLKEYNSFIAGKAIITQFRNFRDQDPLVKSLFSTYGYIYEDHLNILLDCRVEESIIWKGISKSRRKGIKKGMLEGFEFEFSNDQAQLSIFLLLLKKKYRDLGIPHPPDNHFHQLCMALGEEGYTLFSLKDGNCIVISMLALRYKDIMYGYYLGAEPNQEILKRKAMDFFFWKVLEWSIGNRVARFDWMGAGKPEQRYGVRDFKAQFGGDIVNFGRYEKIHYRFIYNLAQFGFLVFKKLKLQF